MRGGCGMLNPSGSGGRREDEQVMLDTWRYTWAALRRRRTCVAQVPDLAGARVCTAVTEILETSIASRALLLRGLCVALCCLANLDLEVRDTGSGEPGAHCSRFGGSGCRGWVVREVRYGFVLWLRRLARSLDQRCSLLCDDAGQRTAWLMAGTKLDAHICRRLSKLRSRPSGNLQGCFSGVM